MRTLQMIGYRDRTLLICHAIRHLLDHAPEDTHVGDVAAIDILQSILNDTASAPAPPHSSTLIGDPIALPSRSQGAYQTPSHDDNLHMRVVGEIAIDRSSLKSILSENPRSLFPMLEALLEALVEEDVATVC